MNSDDMKDLGLSDDQIERLIAGTATPEGLDDVAATFAAMRQVGAHQPSVAATAALREFVSTAPPATDAGHELPQPVPVATSDNPTRRHGMLTGLVATTSAKFALAVGVAIAGVTGAHALGVVDVPLLPAESEPVQLVSAGGSGLAATEPGSSAPQEQAEPSGVAEDRGDPTSGTTEQPAPQEPAASDEAAVADNRFNITSGDISLSVSVEVIDGEPKISVDIEGVSAQCEAAVEALEDLSDLAAVEAASETIEAACGDELGGLDFNLGDFRIDPGTLFGGGAFGEHFGGCFDGLDTANPPTGEALGELFTSCLDGFDLGDFGGSLDPDQFDLEDFGGLDEFLEQFNLEDFNLEDLNLEDFDLEDFNLEEVLKGLGVEDLNLEDLNLEDLNLEDLNLEDLDFSQLGEILKDLDLDQLLEQFSSAGG